MHYDAIVVGGGAAGLTAASFLCKAGRKVLLCEKEDRLGGLVGSFLYKGFTFDTGIRAMENSGILFPMLKQLGIQQEFLDNTVSIGIEERTVDIKGIESLKDYQDMLCAKFPDETAAIQNILDVIRQVMQYMDILYGIDNPLFLDLKQDRKYLMETIVPWMFKYMGTVGKIKRFNMPVEDYLRTLTGNEALISVIAQHFFQKTPAFFALSYFSLYMDYRYPKGGTGSLVSALEDYILAHGGAVKTGTRIASVDPAAKTVTDSRGHTFAYGQLIWAADSKALYASVDLNSGLKSAVKTKIEARKARIADKAGGDSVLTLYLTADLDRSYFGKISGAHFFYTPHKTGLCTLPPGLIQNADGTYIDDRGALTAWLEAFFRLTTFEISIPVMRDETLAPEGKSGLIVSTLLDYALVRHIRDMGWYDDFKEKCRECMTGVLNETVYPKLKESVTDGFVSTPLTLEKRTGNTDGAITGWAFTNADIPAVTSIPKVAKAILTPVPDVVQAGQWTYSPSGFPISVLTGKLAADAAIKKLKR